MFPRLAKTSVRGQRRHIPEGTHREGILRHCEVIALTILEKHSVFTQLPANHNACNHLSTAEWGEGHSA
jgi:hypothetical protein